MAETDVQAPFRAQDRLQGDNTLPWSEGEYRGSFQQKDSESCILPILVSRSRRWERDVLGPWPIESQSQRETVMVRPGSGVSSRDVA